MFLTRIVGSVVAASLLFAGGGVFADTIHVPDDYPTIQGAIDAAVDGDEIAVRPGTYNETIDFLGKAVWLYSTDGAEVTVIDGRRAGSVVTCSSGEGPESILEGFTITGGLAEDGGGMYNSGSSPTVTDCTFYENWADFGGGMLNYGYNESSSPTVTDCTFIGNYAEFYGGGMYNLYSDPMVTDCTFIGNYTFYRGGGMYNDESSPTVTDCTFYDNWADFGGGMYNFGSFAIVTGCTFSGNHAQEGGGMHSVDRRPTITNCTFSENTASRMGGGVYNGSSSPTVTNCTFSGNSANEGGGMYNWGSSPTVTNSIFWGNVGGAIVGEATVSYSDVQGGYAGVGNIDIDPRCDPLGRPHAGSPCIDAGNNEAVPEDVTTALDGHPRFVNDPCTPDTGHPDGLRHPVDMGAYEFQPRCLSDLDCNGEVEFADLLHVLSEWNCTGPCPEDLDGSGVVDFDDVLQVLGEWGICTGPWTIDVPDDYETIQGALYAALDGDEIAVRPGTYNETIDFIGKAVRLYSTDGAEVTTIDATEIGGSVVTCNSGEGLDTILEGFTITGGTGALTTTPRGGGMLNIDSSPTVSECVFTGNTAFEHDFCGSWGRGGGMYNSGGSPSVTNCVFSGNEAGLRGGGMYNSDGNPIVTNCVFSDNVATGGACDGGEGGGMHNSGGSPAVTSCSFSRNYALGEDVWGGGGSLGRGGGIFNADSASVVTNCTFIENRANRSCGGMYNSGATVPTATNSIFWDNDGGSLAGEADVNYSNVQGGYDGIGNIDADPLCDADGRPQAGSPCIDAGANNAVPADILDLDNDGDTAERLPIDLDGNHRFMDDGATEDTGCGPVVVDMGAYEFLGEPMHPVLIGDVGGDGVVDFADLLDVLTAWGECDPACCLADVDFTWRVDTEDLLLVLRNWD